MTENEDRLEGFRGYDTGEPDLTDDERVLAQIEEERGINSQDAQLFRKVHLKQNVEDWVRGYADPKTCARVASLICQKADDELEQLEQRWSMQPDPTTSEMRDAHLRAHAIRVMLAYLSETISEGEEAERALQEDEEAHSE